ncbi:PIG-L family deacetylase [Microvirga pudoricolor]|uniref:PIG-L family deacetylase n=1 Tax=Microvirga pudoricolor TaxID=2778729 RepID=UPI001950FBD1|nr:PIG-L family deacetylase [Microvirga pudoricolor]MBM6594384.1 PIG-L family deacetylase [Microvirga pudoricolor]
MPDDHRRLARAVHEPALVRLHRHLSRLASVVTVMNTGAHPDDEANGLLAALRFAYGMRIVVACSTRGEGGQNALGPERGGALGVLRTAEMEESARRIDADIAWLGHGPADPVHDFGFSKNGPDTLRRWGEERLLERLVRAYRRYRPDIVIPTFLDVPGQHGHHRAMTQAAEAALAMAADPATFPAHAAEGLEPWQVSKFYLPAWSGAGYAYDDEVPPPPATLAVETARDAVTGLTFRQLGEWSRAAHASQGMGVWRDSATDRWELHLKHRAGGAPVRETDIRDGLPASIADLAGEGGLTGSGTAELRGAEDRIREAVGSFPDRGRIAASLAHAGRLIGSALAGADPVSLGCIGHRLRRKQREIDAALLELSMGSVRADVTGPAHPGATLTLDVHADAPGWSDLRIAPRLPHGFQAVETGGNGGFRRFAITIPADAALTGNYAETFDPMGGNGPIGLGITGTVDGHRIAVDRDLDEAVSVVPRHSLSIDPALVVLRQGGGQGPFAVETEGTPATGWDTPPGWEVRQECARWIVEPPQAGPVGLASLVPLVDGTPASAVRPLSYPHIRPAAFVAPVDLKVLTLDVALPGGVRIGYAGGGSDGVGDHLRRLGLDVTDLDAADLSAGDLSEFTTLVVGIFAFGLRPDLRAATDRLRRFVEAGGHLVTLYHRPTDAWDPDHTPPRRLVIGSPSLRWRVTDPSAPVTILAPDHPLLTSPNRIGPQDWADWDKERGLYFVSEASPEYESLIAVNDPGEAPLKGGLVSGRIGRGRHTHVALVLHHQMDKLVPGAFRLMANLVQPA